MGMAKPIRPFRSVKVSFPKPLHKKSFDLQLSGLGICCLQAVEQNSFIMFTVVI